MPAKKGRKARTRSRRPVRRRGANRWAKGLGLFALGLALTGVLYGVYLDQVLRQRFEGKRWSLPARVYARPLELYAGRPLSPETLREELERLGYTRTKHPDRPAAYSDYRGRFLLRTRPFQFADAEEPSHYLEVRLSGGRLTRLSHAGTGQEVPLARLDAALIDSIYPSDRQDRVLVRREDLPKRLVEVLLAVEDRQFYRHHGVDPLAILRALWRNLLAGRVVQGGSTLTQQLVKNFYLSNERSLARKFHEAAMSLILEWRYDKDQILEAYANEIYLGQDGGRAIHGFGLASHFFFNRPLAELDLPRISLLVGMIKGPSYFDPRRHPERARARRDLVIDMAAGQGIVSAAEAARAKAADLGVSSKGGRAAGRYPAFMELVRRQLQQDYRESDLRSEGLRIFTTLDPVVQTRAEQAIGQRLTRLERSARSDRLQAAAVVAGTENGEVLALVGDRRGGYSGFNRALEAVRPIGSLVKPWVYLEALSRTRDYTVVTSLADKPVALRGGDGKTWRPKNFDGKTHGRVPMYLALARSYNLATVNLGLDLGVERVARRIESLGVERQVPRVPSLFLGTLALSPLEVAQAYQVLAAGGFRVPLRAVREVLDATGQPLSRYPLEMKPVVDPAAVYLLNWMLLQVTQQGTAAGLGAQLPRGLRVAGKTGTTDDYRDSWFAGFSGDKVAVVWVGRDDNEPAGLSGAGGAMRVWGDIIAGSDSLPLDLALPGDVAMVWVDSASGLRADAACDGAVQAPFIRGSVPAAGVSCAPAEVQSDFPTAAPSPGEDPISRFLKRLFD